MPRYLAMHATECILTNEDLAFVVEKDQLETVMDIAMNVAVTGTFEAVLQFVVDRKVLGNTYWLVEGEEEVPEGHIVLRTIHVAVNEPKLAGQVRVG